MKLFGMKRQGFLSNGAPNLPNKIVFSLIHENDSRKCSTACTTADYMALIPQQAEHSHFHQMFIDWLCSFCQLKQNICITHAYS